MANGDITACLLCDVPLLSNTRKCCLIFQQRVEVSDRTIVSVINSILGVNLSKDDLHSNVVCRKCYKLCNEVDALEDRLSELKYKLSSCYQTTLKKHLNDNSSLTAKATRLRKPGESSDTKFKERLGGTKQTEISEDFRESLSDVDSHIIELMGEEYDDDRPEIIEIGGDVEDGIIELRRPNMEFLENIQIKCEEEEEIKVSSSFSQRVVPKLEANDDPDYVPPSRTQKKKLDKPQFSLKKEQCEVLVPKMVVLREESVYTCLMCPAEEKFASGARNIISHLKQEHNIRMYICDLCGTEFLRRDELIKHLDNHVNNDDLYCCKTCGRSFNNFRVFEIHTKMHKTQSKNYTCHLCGKRYGSRTLLEEHHNSHTGERPHTCGQCNKSFSSKYTLKAHEKTHESRPRPYICVNCGKSFITQQNLIHHERVHSGIKSYICQECGKSFSTARILENHCILHTGYKPFICRLCGKAFTKQDELSKHEESHVGEKPYQCEFCGASFPQRSNLQAHKRTTHYDEKRYKCTDCGRAFKRRRLLDYHMKAAHTGERPHKCDQCDATFIYPEHFKKHKLIHTGLKPYQCEVCGKAFNSRDNRNAHRFVHSDKKPYECLVCGMGFMRKPQLYNHMNAVGHHNDTIVVNQPSLGIDNNEEKVTMRSTNNRSSSMITDLSSALIEVKDERVQMEQEQLEDEGMQTQQELQLEHEKMQLEDLYARQEHCEDFLHGDSLTEVHEEKVFLKGMDKHLLTQEDERQIVVSSNQTDTVPVVGIRNEGESVIKSTELFRQGSMIAVNQSELEGITFDEATGSLKSENGQIQIVQIRLDEDGSDSGSKWFNFVEATQANEM